MLLWTLTYGWLLNFLCSSKVLTDSFLSCWRTRFINHNYYLKFSLSMGMNIFRYRHTMFFLKKVINSVSDMRVASKPFSVYTSCVVWALPAFCQMKAHAHTGTGIQMGFLSLKMARNYLYNSSLSSIHSTVQGVLSGSAWLFHARSFPVFECEHVSDTEFPEKLSIFLKWIFCAIALSSHLESCSGWDLLYPPHILQMELNELWSFPESPTDETEMLQSPEITHFPFHHV